MLKTTLTIWSNGNSPLKADKVLVDAIKKIPGIISVRPETEKIEGEIIDNKTRERAKV